MSNWESKFADDGPGHNRLSLDLLAAPAGALTHWREAHPNGSSAVWQADQATDKSLLLRFRGGPFAADQSNSPNRYKLSNQIYRCEYEGFTGVVFKGNVRTVHYLETGGDAIERFTVFSIDTPGDIPRTAIRPSGLLDSAIRGRGYHGVKSDNKAFDHLFHVQCEDKAFAKALLTNDFQLYLARSWLARVAAFIIEGSTLSTWNAIDIDGPNGEAYPLDYLSMMIDFLVGIWHAIPPQLRR